LEHAPADPQEAAKHFAARLSVETDPSDVYADFCSGDLGFVLLDARSRDAYIAAHLPGAISFPHREISCESTVGFKKETPIVLYCWGPACNAAHKAATKLASLGFQVKEMIGGFEYWVREGYPIEGTDTVNPDLVGAINASK
jgi:rhodanese-related sulfurtransferase